MCEKDGCESCAKGALFTFAMLDIVAGILCIALGVIIATISYTSYCIVFIIVGLIHIFLFGLLGILGSITDNGGCLASLIVLRILQCIANTIILIVNEGNPIFIVAVVYAVFSLLFPSIGLHFLTKKLKAKASSLSLWRVASTTNEYMNVEPQHYPSLPSQKWEPTQKSVSIEIEIQK